MNQEPQKQSRFFTWLYIPIIAPLIVIFLGAIITGKVVIRISGFQLSVGVTLIIILCILFVMIVSFYLGMLYPLVVISRIFFKKNLPLRFRVLSQVATVILFPLFWFERRQQKSYKAPNNPFDDTHRELAQKIFQSIREKDHNQSADTL